MSITPAPWEIIYAGQDDMTNAECVAEEMPVVSIGPIRYCEFAAGADQDIQREYEDARLMASAPDLLIAAECAKARIESDMEWPGHTTPEGDALRAALAKACGQEGTS